MQNTRRKDFSSIGTPGLATFMPDSFPIHLSLRCLICQKNLLFFRPFFVILAACPELPRFLRCDKTEAQFFFFVPGSLSVR
jgi:hypothetical protein